MTIHWGLLSTAHINRRIIPAIQQSPRGKLLAVASRDPFKAKSYANTWQIPRAYGDYESLVADKDIQVVYISLPNHLHTEWILRSLEAGKHVLCEKPMCLSLEEMTSIEEATRRSGLRVMEGYMHLYHPQAHLWKSVTDSGILGEIHAVRSNFSFTLERGPENYRWNADAGGGALWDVGIYPVSLFQYLLNDSPVSGIASSYVADGVDHSTTAQLHFKSGCTGQFFVSFRSAFSSDTVIHGSHAQLHISHPFTNVDACQAFIQSGHKKERLDIPRQYLYSGEVEEMHEMIITGKEPTISLADSRRVLETILMLKGK